MSALEVRVKDSMRDTPQTHIKPQSKPKPILDPSLTLTLTLANKNMNTVILGVNKETYICKIRTQSFMTVILSK